MGVWVCGRDTHTPIHPYTHTALHAARSTGCVSENSQIWRRRGRVTGERALRQPISWPLRREGAMNSRAAVEIRSRSRTCLAYLLWVTLLLAPLSRAAAEIQIKLNNSFIQEYKHRATIKATFTVDKTHKHPNPPSKDGDMHIA